MRLFTETDDAYIIANAGTMPAIKIAANLERSRSTLQRYANKTLKISLRLKGDLHKSSKLSNLQVEIIKALEVCGFSASEIHKACFDHVNRNTVQLIHYGVNRKEL